MWFVIRVKPRQDAKTSRFLHTIGMEHYLPGKKELARNKDLIKEKIKPVLSPYMFVKCRPGERTKVYDGGSVLDFLKDNGKPVQVSQEEIDRLRQICDGCFDAIWSRDPIKVGDAVEVIAGAMKGVQGLAIQEHGRWNMYVLIESLGRYVRFSIARSLLRRLKFVNE
ncbi:MAG: UpxY family transcription antiterminator [Saprospiraceae bacterium]|nr:UpxY family transcription antiterminator [Saprospiraceae bacterium]